MILQTNLIWLFISLAISAVVYPIVINLLYKFQFREKIRADGPETHLEKKGTPTMGGIGFFVVTFILNLVFNFSYTQTALVLFVFAVAAIFGFTEDWFKAYGKSKLRKDIRIEVYEVFSKSKKTWGIYKVLLVPWNLFREAARIVGSNKSNEGVKLKSHYKVLMHFALGFLIGFWVYFKLDWSSMAIPFYGDLEMGILYPIFIAVFFVFTLNATAITDGLDGLLGGLTLLVLPVYWVIALVLNYYGISNFISIFIGSLIVYLYFNVFPARVFMADVGSYAIAGALFMIPLVMRVEFLIFITHVIYLFDGGISGVAQQLSVKYRGKRIFKMAPVHHHFEMLGWPETKVTMRFWILQTIVSLFGLLVFTYMF
jgi:phospho-N-acetylmuramoyl-pentapeptide-transferase